MKLRKIADKIIDFDFEDKIGPPFAGLYMSLGLILLPVMFLNFNAGYYIFLTMICLNWLLFFIFIIIIVIQAITEYFTYKRNKKF